MKRTYSILFVSFGMLLGGCGTNALIRKGDRLAEAEAYSLAVVPYKKALDKKASTDVKAKLGDAYYKLNNPRKAEEYFREVVADTASAAVYQYRFAKVLMQNGKYGEAKTALQNYLRENPENVALVKGLLEVCENPKKFENALDTCEYAINKVELQGFNSYFGAAPYNFGYVFAADNLVDAKKGVDKYSGATFLDLYYTKKDQKTGKYAPAEPVKGGVNSEYHDAFSTFSADGKTMYFTRSNLEKGKVKKNKNQQVTLQVLKAVFLEGEWTNIERLPFNSDEFNTSHPALSPDGKTLYFVSDRPGGQGMSDLWMATTSDGGATWSEPQNLGSTINTPGRETAPTIGFDEKLYFSSDGHAGMGGLDIFVSSRNGSSWSAPTNMKGPINSSKDDFSLSFAEDKKSGILSSTRGSADSDLSPADVMYEFRYKDPIVRTSVCVQVKETGKPISGAVVYATDKNTGKEYTAETDAQGNAMINLPGNSDFNINAKKANFISASFEFSTKGRSCAAVANTCEEGNKVLIEEADVTGTREYSVGDIYYDYNKSNIRKDAEPNLDKLVKILTDNPELKVEMGSHTDCRGTDEYNQKLSEARAKAVVKYCTNRGIDAKRMTFKGYGKSSRLTTCDCKACSEEEWQKDRRTTFKIIK